MHESHDVRWLSDGKGLFCVLCGVCQCHSPFSCAAPCPLVPESSDSEAP